MADDIAVTPGTGKTVAAEDKGGRLFQIIKLAIGGAGSAVLLAFGQATKANSLPVVLASDQDAVPVADANAAAQGATALQAIAATGTWQSAVIAKLTAIVTGLGGVVLAGGSAVIGKVSLQVNGQDHSASAPIYTSAVPPAALTPTETTPAITAGGTISLAANSNRKTLTVQNNNASGFIRVSTTGTASATAGMLFNPGQGYDWPSREVPLGAVSVYSSVAGTVYFRESV